MAKKEFIAGTGVAEYFSMDGQKIFSAKTLMDSSINISASEEEVRGGQGHVLLGKYYHTTGFGLKLQDALFDLNYLSLKVGSDITIGGDILTSEVVTVGSGGAITVLGTPKNFLGGLYGWYGDNKRCTFTGQKATLQGFNTGDKVTVQYYANDDAVQELTVNANFIPSVGYLVLRASLFSGDPTDVANSTSKVGDVIVEVPSFQLGSSTDLSMTSSGASQTSLDGSALATMDAENPDGYYAKIKLARKGGKWYDTLIGLAIDSSDDVNVGDVITVYGVFKNAKSKPISPDKLTFTGCDATGKVTGSASSKLTVTVKDAPFGTPIAKIIAEATIKA